MRAIMSIILMFVLSVASATAGIRLYCDYQGNVRQVADAQGNVLEQNDYYPYGGLFGESASHQNYKYSGKELETMNSLNTYDFHARPYYYPVLQFHSPDILSEKTPWLSPYLYCAGNPIMLIDPTGKYFESLWDAANIVMGVNSLWNNIKEGNVGAAIVDGVGVVVDAVAIALPVVPGGASSIIRAARAADDVVDAVRTANKATDVAKTGKISTKEVKIEISPENKIDRNLLNAPKRTGNAPTFKKDGEPVEIHHMGQDPNGPFVEMHPKDHRGQGNYKNNHPDYNKPSSIDRNEFNKAKKKYWQKEYPNENK